MPVPTPLENQRRVESRPATATLKLHNLTALRFAAALGVVLFHVGRTAVQALSGTFGSIAAAGYANVGLFYVLSGFVLAYNYADRDSKLRAFYLARLARVYPIYALALVLALPAFLMHARQDHLPIGKLSASLVLAPAMMQAWIPQVALIWNTPAWSLSVEAFFYLLFPIALVALTRVRLRSFPAVGIALWGLALLPSLIYCLTNPDGLTTTYRTRTSWSEAETTGWLSVINFFPLLRLPEFLAGVLLGLMFKRQLRSGRPCPKVITSSFLALGSLTAIVIFFAKVAESLPYPVIHNGLLLPLWCVLIYGLAMLDVQRNDHIRVPAIIVLLGEASYGVYILQQPISNFFKLFLASVTGKTILGDYPNLALFGAYCAILCGVSVATFKWVETPLRGRITNWNNRAATPLAGDNRTPYRTAPTK